MMKQRNEQPSKTPACEHDHVHSTPAPRAAVDPRALETAASLFRAMGDTQRLGILQYLAGGECCVTELVQATSEKFSTISQRLRILRTEGLVRKRREGLHVYYSLADQHVADLVANALAHAGELLNPGKSHNHGSTQDVAKDEDDE